MDFKAQRPDVSGSFLPEDYVAAQSENRANFLVVLMFTVIMGLIVSAFLITNRRWQAIHDREATVNAAYKQEEEKIKQLHELKRRQAAIVEKAEIVNALTERIPRSILLAEFNTRRPSQAVVILDFELSGERVRQASGDPSKQAGQVRSLSNKVAVRKTNQQSTQERPKVQPPRFKFSLSLVGVSPQNALITDYLSNLSACPLVKNVELEYIEKTIVDNEELRKFRIVAELRDDVDARILADGGEGDRGVLRAAGGSVVTDEDGAGLEGLGGLFRMGRRLAGADETGEED